MFRWNMSGNSAILFRYVVGDNTNNGAKNQLTHSGLLLVITPTTAQKAGGARKGEIELVQTAFGDEQKAYDALKDNFGKVKT